MSEPLVIVGNGMAAARLVDELAKVALGRYAIAVIGDEPRLAYTRVLLSSVLAGETASHDIELRPASWWRAAPGGPDSAPTCTLQTNPSGGVPEIQSPS